jgi:hypothetical protein
MNFEDVVVNDYFYWMYHLVCGDRYPEEISFKKLLMHLHDTEFTYSILRDENRAQDGIDLRRRFELITECPGVSEYLRGPCSVLEMMVALAIRCEENIMDDPSVGDRTGQWFWGMVVNLGLGAMNDRMYDERFVEESLMRFLNRDYEPDGKGGLFTVRDHRRDLRTVEIWYQLCWYLDSIM